MTPNSTLRIAGAALLCCAGLHGQEALSTLRGTASDPSGSMVPNVSISVQETSTNILARKVVTDGQGNYEIPGLKQGTYRLTATVPGFRVFAANDIILESNQVRRID